MTTPILITATFFSLFMIPITLLAQQQHDEGSHPAAVIPPGEGDKFWHEPSSQADLGEGAFINIKVDRVSVPYTNMVALTQTLAASGIPVHLHTFEDELIYVISGQGAAIVGDDREEVALEAGSVVYIPIGEWHGVRNANPEQRMEILLVTNTGRSWRTRRLLSQRCLAAGSPTARSLRRGIPRFGFEVRYEGSREVEAPSEI